MTIASFSKLENYALVRILLSDKCDDADSAAAACQPGSAQGVELVAKILRDEEEFQCLVDQFSRQIRLKAFRYADQQADQMALCNEIFSEVFLSLANFQGKSSLARWIDTIATRICLRHLRQKYRERVRREVLQTLIPWKVQGCDSPDSKLLAREQIESCMSLLRPQERVVLTMLYWEEKSIKEAADSLSWTESKIKVTAYRARKKLKRFLERQDEE